VHSDKNRWVTRQPPPIERTIFARAWAREKLRRVRDLVRSALHLVEVDGRAAEAAAQLRITIAQIDAELAKIE
jgi:hypothetical protein